MPKRAVPADQKRDTARERMAATLAASGIVVSADEASGLADLDEWLHTGIATLQRSLPSTADADDSVLDLDLMEQGRRLRDGRLTSVALVEAICARIGEHDAVTRAFYSVLRDTALAEAARADAELASGHDRGPLHGIPVGIKDIIDVAGVATTANAPGRADAVAARDAALVGRLRAAGAVIIGKLATYEWATVGPDRNGLFPPARNPWKPDHITGGSSSGCAAAVAAGLVRTSVGTDTGGSVRGPAFYCGVVGLKPTYGAVPMDGVLDLAPSLDHAGPIAASTTEAALTLDALAGRHEQSSAARLIGEPIAGKRIGYARAWFADDPQTMPAILEAMDAALSTFSRLGADIAEIDLPDPGAVEVAVAAILHAEGFALHREHLRDAPEGYGRRAFLSLATGAGLAVNDLEEARRAGRAFTRAVDACLAAHDVLVTVGALTTALPAAPFEAEAVWTPMRTIGFNVSGHPVLALPVGFHEGLPIGMQIIGRHGAEAEIVQFGDAFERATDHTLQRPPRPGR